MGLANTQSGQPTWIHHIAASEAILEKSPGLILGDLKTARLLESVRGASGGYRLKRHPSKIYLGETIRTIDGPPAPFAGAQGLRRLAKQDRRHGALCRVFLDVRNSAARILGHNSLVEIKRSHRARILGRGV